MKIIFLTTFVVGWAVVLGLPTTQITSGNLTAPSGHDIIYGKCTNTTDADLVFHDYLHLTRIPFFTRSGKSHWHGDQIIYCIKALNQKSQQTGGSANITEGGVGHTFVTIQMESYVSHGIEFYIYVWAE
ncbi:unnamed protein product [Ceutorhynchus assimilis]|uniref:Uncharacterized protein n=1 Tax=Ceutorhynchus assimilis TaxID=467358 RepID=A0A9N9MTS0_9CUCU|nr:unnamed protein product [Ceutorhynchus assimilis]